MHYKVVITRVETAIIDVPSPEEATQVAKRFNKEVCGEAPRTMPVNSSFHRVSIHEPDEPLDRILSVG